MDIAIVSLFAAILSAAVITFDLKKNPQQMRIMNLVWILTALWGSLFALILYFCFGKERGSEKMHKMSGMQNMMGMEHMQSEDLSGSKMIMAMRPKWQSVTLSTLHCGAGCTLADIIGSILLFFISIAFCGSTLYSGWIFSYILALVIGVYIKTTLEK